MSIEGEHAGRSIREVWLQLTRLEAERLMVVIDQMLGPDGDVDPEWHAHGEGDDGQSVIAIGWGPPVAHVCRNAPVQTARASVR